MPDATDMDLVREFARDHSERAFAELVRRHLNLVYSVALRHTGQDGDAQDIAQAVFIVLARKAAGLRAGTVLAGWLYETTRFTAARWQRTNARRHAREQEAYMQSLQTDSAETWRQLAPHLEAAMSRLPERDRTLLALRFYENKTGPEAAALLGIREDAAHKRTARALDKLRKFFGKRGIALSAAAIAGAVSANSVQAAPAELALKISVVAGKGLATTTTIATLVKGTLNAMTWLKIKFAMGVGLAAVLAGGAATLAILQTTGSDRLTVQEIAQQTQAAYAALTSYSDTSAGMTEGGGTRTEMNCKIQLQRPKQYRVEWTSTGGFYASKAIVWSDGGANFYVMAPADKFDSAPAQKTRDMQQAFAFANGVSGAIASTIPAAFYNLAYGDSLGAVASGRTETKREADEKVGEIDCHVVVSVLDLAKILPQAKTPKVPNIDIKSFGTTTTTLWIGKKDHLIHQVRTTTAGQSIAMKFTEEMLQRQLQLQNKPVTPENLAALQAEMEKSAALALKNGFIFTETHENIVVNRKFPTSDFAR